MGKIVLTSHGLHTPLGYEVIAPQLPQEMCEESRILLITLPEYEINADLIFWCRILGFAEENITVFDAQKADLIKQEQYDVFYVSEGNTFDLLQYMRDNDLMEMIREGVADGACYVGASAGAHIAGLNVEAAIPFDKNRVEMTDFTALGLFEGVAFPHFDTSDYKRMARLMDIEKSGRYSYVAVIGEMDVEVMEDPFQKILREAAREMEHTDEKADFQRIQIETLTGEIKDATILSVEPFKGKEYAILLLHNTDGSEDLDTFYVEKDESNNDKLVSIENPLDKMMINRRLARMMGAMDLPLGGVRDENKM